MAHARRAGSRVESAYFPRVAQLGWQVKAGRLWDCQDSCAEGKLVARSWLTCLFRYGGDRFAGSGLLNLNRGLRFEANRRS